MQVPFFSFRAFTPAMEQQFLQRTQSLIARGDFILGTEVEQFEHSFATYCGVNHCVGVGNGLDALRLALLALGIGPGDEVLVPSNTYIATWLAVSQTGAVPVPVEPDTATRNITVEGIEKSMTNKTKAVIPVHLYGLPCSIEAIMDYANAHQLWVVEDCAQAHGATFKGKQVGAWGHINATSFYPSKNLGAMGDGGAVLTDDAALAEKVKRLRNYGSAKKYYHEEAGFNSRLDSLQAAALSVKLPHLNDWNKSRQTAAATYHHHLASEDGLQLPVVADGATHVYHLYVIHTERRDALQQYLKECAVQTLIHYPVPPHRQKAYEATHRQYSLPVADYLAATSLSLPIFPGITEAEVDYVCQCIKIFFK